MDQSCFPAPAAEPAEAPPSDGTPADVVLAVRDKARALYRSRRLMCSEAILAAVNVAFAGGLTEGQAVALASAMPAGLGGSGCLCGALGGAAVALGLTLGRAPAPVGRRAVRQASARLHDRFKEVHGATCCRALTRQVKDDAKAHFAQCEAITAWTAEAAARMILELRPDLARSLGCVRPSPRGWLDRLKRLIRP